MYKPALKYYISALLVLLLYSSCKNTFAGVQPDRESYLKERLLVITDRNIYFTGEKIWLKIICTESIYGVPVDLSKVVYYELLTADNNPVVRQKSALKGGFGSGCITLPEGLTPGIYRIRAYTNWMKNFGHGCFSVKKVIIINPDKEILFRKPLAKGQKVITDDSVSASYTLLNDRDEIVRRRPVYKKPADSLDIDILAGRDVYGTREKVNITVRTSVNGSPVSANLSVKVKKSGDPVEGEETDLQNLMITDSALMAYTENTDTLSGQPNIMFLPEIKGQIISGRVIDKESKEPVWNHEVFLSYVGSPAQIYICRTNREGEFSFSPGEEFLNREMIVQLDDSQGKYILLLNDMFSDSFEEQHAQPALKSEYKDYILRGMINSQITSAYGERDSAPGTAPERGLSPKTWALSPFYGNPDESIMLSDYIKLPVMEEVLVELLKRVFISVRKGVKYILIIDNNSNEIIGNSPLYLIDGVPVFDPSIILNLEPAAVKKISVVTSKYYYGDMVFDGILDIQTHGNKFENVAKLKTAIHQKPENNGCSEVFTSPRYESEIAAGSRIPDYRNTIYWNPEIITDSEGTAAFSFYCSDETGCFDIIVEVMISARH
jgi:hypothetical protein